MATSFPVFLTAVFRSQPEAFVLNWKEPLLLACMFLFLKLTTPRAARGQVFQQQRKASNVARSLQEPFLGMATLVVRCPMSLGGAILRGNASGEHHPTDYLARRLDREEKIARQLGTLGGGNHFLEVVYSESDEQARQNRGYKTCRTPHLGAMPASAPFILLFPIIWLIHDTPTEPFDPALRPVPSKIGIQCLTADGSSNPCQIVPACVVCPPGLVHAAQWQQERRQHNCILL